MTSEVESIYNYVITLFNKKLKSEADELENRRKIIAPIYNLINGLAILSGVLAGVVLLLIIILYFSPHSTLTEATFDSGIFPLICGLFIFSSCFLLLIKSILFNLFSFKVKRKLFSEIYKALDINLNYIPGRIKLFDSYELEMIINMFLKRPETYRFEAIINGLDILPFHHYVEIDDVIYGKYQDHEVNIVEFSLIERREEYTTKGGRKTRYYKVFNGVLFQTSMVKNIQSRVYKAKGSKFDF